MSEDWENITPSDVQSCLKKNPEKDWTNTLISAVKEIQLLNKEIKSLGKLTSRISELEERLGNLLAIIHRDGGHYEQEHGEKKACEDAQLIVANHNGIEDKISAMKEVGDEMYKNAIHFDISGCVCVICGDYATNKKDLVHFTHCSVLKWKEVTK